VVLVQISTWSTQAELEFILADSGVTTLFSVASVGKEDFVGSLKALRSRLPKLTTLIMVGRPPPDFESLLRPMHPRLHYVRTAPSEKTILRLQIPRRRFPEMHQPRVETCGDIGVAGIVAPDMQPHVDMVDDCGGAASRREGGGLRVEYTTFH
jgi:hypothetical protein